MGGVDNSLKPDMTNFQLAIIIQYCVNAYTYICCFLLFLFHLFALLLFCIDDCALVSLAAILRRIKSCSKVVKQLKAADRETLTHY